MLNGIVSFLAGALTVVLLVSFQVMNAAEGGNMLARAVVVATRHELQRMGVM